MTKDERRLKFLSEHPEFETSRQSRVFSEGNERWYDLHLEERRQKRRKRGTMARI